MEENIIKIVGEDRILRILQKVAQANLQVYMRWPKDPSTAVKGVFGEIIKISKPHGQFEYTIKIRDISVKGNRFLSSKDQIQIEFVLMSTKIVFASRVVSRDASSIITVMPKQLLSIERRKNSRYKSIPNFMAFMKLAIHRVDLHDSTASPFFSPYQDLAGALRVDDVSLGGISVSTNFPSILRVAKRGVMDEHSVLTLPLQKSIACSIEIRWLKKITEQLRDHEGKIRETQIFKLGLQFTASNQELEDKLKVYISQLTKAEAI